MKKITFVLWMAVMLSACNPEPPSTAKQPAQAPEQTAPVQEIGNQDISEVTTEDLPAEQEAMNDEFMQSSNEPPVELHLSEQFNEHAAKMGNGNYLQLDVSAIADQVTIHNVTVNRGNTCAPRFWYRSWPGHGSLKFGQAVRAHITCDFHAVKEISVETDSGAYTFNF